MGKKAAISAMVGSLLLLSSASSTKADFYNDRVDNWVVFGFDGEVDNNRACVMEYKYQDGSKFQLIADLVDGEIYIWFKNHQWNISDAPGEYDGMTILIEGSGGTVRSWDAIYQLSNKNTILIRHLEGNNELIDSIAYLHEMKFIMPGTIENASVPLEGSTRALESMITCLEISS